MENNTPLLIKFTHLQTGRPTYIKANDITCVRENNEGKTLILQGTSGQYVAESADQVLETLSMYGFGVA